MIYMTLHLSKPIIPHGVMEFHVSRAARDRYQFDQSLFSLSGNVIFANFHASRQFAIKMNTARDLIHFPEQTVRAGQINAMGLIDEILHYVFGLYRTEQNPLVVDNALEWLEKHLGPEAVDRTLRQFCDQFPPVAVYNREIDVEVYLKGETNGTPNRHILLEELLLLWLANVNPAFAPFLELFDDTELEKRSHYRQLIEALDDFFETQEKYGPKKQNIIQMLRDPAVAVPHSLSGQLEYIRKNWGFLLGKYLFLILRSIDLVKEEEKAVFFGPGPALVYQFRDLEPEPERFSKDLDWMPRVVLIAKNIYVWLDQLSKKYQQHIHRLDQIPDEVLDELAAWGFTGLWLIGLWERSQASKSIKVIGGNPDAVASAYSLYDYQIAYDLGGEDAYANLRHRAWERGIRLASDMVPNHMGIDSKWMLEHPNWFISLDYSPFPVYSFNGPNLSSDDRVGIYIEDQYYSRSDAAVVFKRVDHHTGDEKYVYHGNDGTNMPWNDTAQLNFLDSEVREAVIQTILHVARKFAIIRFDAAMTLAKKHYQRLWFPEPGTGGAIPSRAEFGLTKDLFNAAMPVEFWREVVDRVAQEVPDTLLLAEAFWLMEGYFVRTLGMHRVYNSAFMNMLRDEENANYRSVMKNTLEFDPQILKRFVNFMNNPDERTAVEQFGKGDKYFGICVLMCTLPGLPMFGHGQIEGYAEKYGMEYQRAYWDEKPDTYLMDRHDQEIFPLLHRRRLFAEVNNFLLYDFFTTDGFVNEDVFAFSNRLGDERGLVVYHNKYAHTSGWIRNSVAFAVKDSSSNGRSLVQKTLAEGLEILDQPSVYTIFRDHKSGLEYIRNNQDIHNNGIFVELDAYRYQVLLDFQQVQDNEWGQYAQLTEFLNGRGVPSIDEAAKEIFLRPIHIPYRDLVNHGMFQWLLDNRLYISGKNADSQVLEEVEIKSARLIQEISNFSQGEGNQEELVREICEQLQWILESASLIDRLSADSSDSYKEAIIFYTEQFNENQSTWLTLLGWLFTHSLGKTVSSTQYAHQARSWIDGWLLGKILVQAFLSFGMNDQEAWDLVTMIKIMTTHQDWFQGEPGEPGHAYSIIRAILNDPDVQSYLQVNRYQDILWFNKEAFENLVRWLFAVSAILVFTDADSPQDLKVEEIIQRFKVVKVFLNAAEISNFQVLKMLENLNP